MLDNRTVGLIRGKSQLRLFLLDFSPVFTLLLLWKTFAILTESRKSTRHMPWHIVTPSDFDSRRTSFTLLCRARGLGSKPHKSLDCTVNGVCCSLTSDTLQWASERHQLDFVTPVPDPASPLRLILQLHSRCLSIALHDRKILCKPHAEL